MTGLYFKKARKHSKIVLVCGKTTPLSASRKRGFSFELMTIQKNVKSEHLFVIVHTEVLYRFFNTVLPLFIPQKQQLTGKFLL